MIVVVDASVAIKWYVDEDHTAEAEHLITEQFELHAPELLLSEFGNILWKKCLNSDVNEETAKSILDTFLERPIVLHSQKEHLKSAFSGALRTRQSVYDWAYLSLSMSLSCPLVTADRKFYLGLRNTPFWGSAVWVENIPKLI